MKVYLLHEISGEYEDYRDYVIEVYEDKLKVEAKLEELKLKTIQMDKCFYCVCEGGCIPNCDEESCGNCNDLGIKYVKANCDISNPYINENGDLQCKNSMMIGFHSEIPRYYIEEISTIK